jgi:hypothetical protein
MIDLLDIRCVRLGARDLGTADLFARDAIGLQGVRKEHGACDYRIDSRDHALVHFEAAPPIAWSASNCVVPTRSMRLGAGPSNPTT